MKSIVTIAGIALAVIFTGCAPWNAVTRQAGGPEGSPGKSAYIESHRTSGPNYSCSFIEFDGKGGFLSFPQFEEAKKTVDKLKKDSDVLLVIYCHGWNNNSQSGDVLRFTSFLRRLADSSAIRAKHKRVHGVYLGWRGSEYFPSLAKADLAADPKLAEDFGADLTDAQWQLPDFAGTLLAPARGLSYWAIKSRAEFHVSRVPLARAVFRLAFMLKSPAELNRGRKHEVFVLGHSFGALMLEQAIGQASVGLITSEWNRDARDARWPFDLIVFLNSAAPSLYAKQLGEFLQEDVRQTAKPRIVSITSTGDWATGLLHPIGNLGGKFSPDLRREYHPYGRSGPTVRAWQYYDQTPGHNPYLINYEVVKAEGTLPSLADSDAIFARNLLPGNEPGVFYTKAGDGHPIQAWKLEDLTKPRPGTDREAQRHFASNYWIATVPPDIIRDHTDIWSPACMEMLAGIYRTVDQLGRRPAQAQTAAKTRND